MLPLQSQNRNKVPWMSGLVSGLQNRVRRFESARNLKKSPLENYSKGLFFNYANIFCPMLKHILKAGIRLLATTPLKMLYKHHLLKPSVIVKVDGGLCSQMHFYLIGCLFLSKNCQIEFDLHWFKISGKDSKGEFCRNFDLLKLFPNLPFKKASQLKSRLYAILFPHANNYFQEDNELAYLNLTPPIYLTGYYKDPDYLYHTLFKQYFTLNKEILDIPNQAIWKQIEETKDATAIHVRRGDLSTYHPAYGTPCTSSYFSQAIHYLSQRHSPACFYIFSDEPEWCKQALIPHLPINEHYQVVDLNGSDKGYMDLVLMSCCPHQITSQGSLGKFAALLKQQKGETIVYDNECNRNWEKVLPDSILIGN